MDRTTGLIKDKLRSCGMANFVRLLDTDLTTPVTKKLKKEGYTYSSAHTIVSNARWIVNNGYEHIALAMIVHSIRTSEDVRKKARSIWIKRYGGGRNEAEGA